MNAGELMSTRWFGTQWPSPKYPAPICEDPSARVDVPVGEHCALCDEPVLADDSGVVMPHGDLGPDGRFVASFRPQHAECATRMTVGSIAHIEGRCACPPPLGVGGAEPDPGMRFRQEARMVFARMMEGAWRGIQDEILLDVAREALASEPAGEPETDFDHVFVPKPYTKTCWYRLQDCGGRCEHLEQSSVHRGSPFRFEPA